MADNTNIKNVDNWCHHKRRKQHLLQMAQIYDSCNYKCIAVSADIAFLIITECMDKILNISSKTMQIAKIPLLAAFCNHLHKI